ncbi:MAG: ornithine carbamoyltransferase, partial [Pirellulaceae bacterium]|nr:ornithine carbamoyltransferase [Pirellulaceae bacterium]
MRNLLTLCDLTPKEIETVFAVTKDLKTKYQEGLREPLLPGRVMALLFEKQSLRTRVSFETAMVHLGGGSLFLGRDVGWGERESIADFGQVLSQYCDVVVCRANSHNKIVQLAEHCDCSVVNGLTDLAHPCQALADLFTMSEIHGALRGLKLAFVGDANNVARSLALACGKTGVQFSLASPAGYRFDDEFMSLLATQCPDATIEQTADAASAVDGAAAVYTDVWTSMGQEAERIEREKAFQDFQIDSKLMAGAHPDACFLHCL